MDSDTQIIDASPSLEDLARAVDEALAEVKSLDEPHRDKALNLKDAVEAFHKEGLKQIVRTMQTSEAGRRFLRQLAKEPTVYALLTLHGLVRTDWRAKVPQVLELIRPYLQSHGGDVSLVDIRDRTVVVRLSGACDGCSMSAETLQHAVADALRERIPEIEAVEAAPSEATLDGFVSIDSLQPPGAMEADGAPRSRPSSDNGTKHGWIAGPELAEIPLDEPIAVDFDRTSVLIAQTPNGLHAYHNRCAHQGLPLHGGLWDPDQSTLACPWHGYRFNMETGECLTNPHCRLTPLPLRVVDGILWARPE